jgi:hypothetical protein
VKQWRGTEIFRPDNKTPFCHGHVWITKTRHRRSNRIRTENDEISPKIAAIVCIYGFRMIFTVNSYCSVGLEVLTAVSNSAIFCNVTPCSLAGIHTFRRSLLPPLSESKRDPSRQQDTLGKLANCLAYSLILKMEAVYFFEPLVNRTAWHYNPEGSNSSAIVFLNSIDRSIFVMQTHNVICMVRGRLRK